MEAPSIRLLAAEQASFLEFGAFLAARPYLGWVPRGEPRPVLVLPGFTADDRSTAPLRRFLRDCGHWAHGWQQGRNMGPTARALSEMRRRLAALHELHQARVTVVGWSLGGVYARELARETPAHVRQVITLAAPFRLTRDDQTVVSPLWKRWARFHAEPSEWWNEHRRLPLTVPSTAIYTRTDGIVPWASCIEAEGAQRESIEVYGSHSGLGFNVAALIAVADRLAQPDNEWRPFRPPPWLSYLYPRPARADAAA